MGFETIDYIDMLSMQSITDMVCLLCLLNYLPPTRSTFYAFIEAWLQYHPNFESYLKCLPHE